MADKPRKRPYIWVSWLTKLLAEEDYCWYKAWFKAHFKYDRTPDDADREDFFAEYTRRHDELTSRANKRLQASGFVTRVEDASEFRLAGKSADLAGKPDLVGIKDTHAVVIDAKAGKKRDSDHWQVLIYIFGLGLSWLQGFSISGRIEYKDGPENVKQLGKREQDMIVEAINRVSGDIELPPTPSPGECRFCDVASCPARFRSAPSADATRYF